MEKTVYELMHGEKVVADIGTNGVCTVLDRAFLPFSIYLEDTAENDDLDIRMDNLTNFYYWCATRVLTLDRVYSAFFQPGIALFFQPDTRPDILPW